MSTEPIIQLKNVTKVFNLVDQDYRSIKYRFVNLFRKNRNSREKGKFHALKNVSFDILPGEFVSIVGRNGSGKSTILKILAGVYEQDSGKVQVDGSVVPFLELGVGFNPDLTGKENIFLNGAILGISRKKIKSYYRDIVDFAAIEEFINTQVKHYSSGMFLRLAFSIAIMADADIYLMDEVLGVGDAGFQSKCFQKFEEFRKQGKTIIYVSHNMKSVTEYSDRVILMDKGEVKEIGSPDSIEFKYSNILLANQRGDLNTENKDNDSLKYDDTDKILSAIPSDEKGNEDKFTFKSGEYLFLKIKIDVRDTSKALHVGVIVYDKNSQFHLFNANSFKEDIKFRWKKGTNIILFGVKSKALNRGDFSYVVTLFRKGMKNEIDRRIDIFESLKEGISFTYLAGNYEGSPLDLGYSWDLVK